MSIKKLLVGTATSLLLAGGLSITASAEEYDNYSDLDNIQEDTGSGVELPSDMKVGDVHEETVAVDNGEVKYTVTKSDEELDQSGISVMSEVIQNQTVPVSGTASFTVRGEFGTQYAEFIVNTRDGLIDSVLRGPYYFAVGVDSADLTLHHGRLATYDFQTSMAVDWIGGPAVGLGVRARMESPGPNVNINNLATEIY